MGQLGLPRSRPSPRTSKSRRSASSPTSTRTRWTPTSPRRSSRSSTTTRRSEPRAWSATSCCSTAACASSRRSTRGCRPSRSRRSSSTCPTPPRPRRWPRWTRAPGQIRAIFGGTDFNVEQFNFATQGRRQPGSSFKPMVMATALEMGFPLNLPPDRDQPRAGSPPATSGRTSGVENYGGGSYGRRRPAQRADPLDQHRVRAAGAHRGHRQRPGDRAADGHRRRGRVRRHPQPLDRAGRVLQRRDPAGDGLRLRDVRVRRSARPGLAHRPGRDRRRRRDLRAQQRPAAGLLRLDERGDDRDHAVGGHRRHGDPRAGRRAGASAARPGPRRPTPTPGSSATRRCCPPRCGWATPRAASRCPARPAATSRPASSGSS